MILAHVVLLSKQRWEESKAPKGEGINENNEHFNAEAQGIQIPVSLNEK